MKINYGENTIAIIYVGPKAVKRDTVTAFKPQLQFKRGESTDVPASVAHSLLAFSCFVPASDDVVENMKKEQELKLKEEQEAAELAEKLKQEEADKTDTIVSVDGEDIDLGKFTSGKLDTFVEAHDLDVKQGNDKVDEYRLRVRDAYREKAGE